jgi:hypothetical protein
LVTEKRLTYVTLRAYALPMGTSAGDLRLVSMCADAGDKIVGTRNLRTLRSNGYLPRAARGWMPSERDVTHARWAVALTVQPGKRHRSYAPGYVLRFLGFDVSDEVVMRDLTEFYGESMTTDDDDARVAAGSLLHDTSDRGVTREHVRRLQETLATPGVHGVRTERHEAREVLVSTARAIRGHYDLTSDDGRAAKDDDLSTMLTGAGAATADVSELLRPVRKIDFTGQGAVEFFSEDPTESLRVARAWFGWMDRYMPPSKYPAVRAHEALEVAAAHYNMDGHAELIDYPSGLQQQLKAGLRTVLPTLPGLVVTP